MGGDQRLVEMAKCNPHGAVPLHTFSAASAGERAALQRYWDGRRAPGAAPVKAAPPPRSAPALAPRQPSPAEAAVRPIYPVSPPPPAPPSSPEQMLRAEWDASPALRASYNNVFGYFASHSRALVRQAEAEARTTAARPVLLDPVALEAAAEKAWAEDRTLREEFGFNKACWLAYARNEGPRRVGGRIAR